jgi:hypothetical protein
MFYYIKSFFEWLFPSYFTRPAAPQAATQTTIPVKAPACTVEELLVQLPPISPQQSPKINAITPRLKPQEIELGFLPKPPNLEKSHFNSSENSAFSNFVRPNGKI